MRIIHAKVFQNDGTFKEQDLLTEQDRIVESGAGAQEEIDGFDLFALPACINIGVSGTDDVSFDDASAFAIDAIGKDQAAGGSGVWLGRTHGPAQHLEKVAHATKSWMKNEAQQHPECATLVGLSLEDPLAHIKSAKPSDESWKDLARDDVDALTALQKEANDSIKLVEINPADEAADEYIKLIAPAVSVLVAGDDASYVDCEQAIKAGATLVQKSWKEKFERNEKNPSVCDALFQNHTTYLNLVASQKTAPACDVVATFALFQGRIVLSSWDNNMLAAVRRAHEMGVPQKDAILAATLTPAIALGLEKDYGSLEAGKKANILFVDKYFELKHVIHEGKLIF